MEKIGELEIKITGKEGSQELNPDTYDIRQLATLLDQVEALLNPEGQKSRPRISYDLQEGSVRHIFRTSMQAVIGLSAVLSQVEASGSIDFLQGKTAQAIASLQEQARKKNYSFELKTSLHERAELRINPQSSFFLEEGHWIEAEFYFYGVLKNAGGKTRANIHLDTDDYGYLTIHTGENFLKDQEENLLYKQFGVRAKGKQHSVTGELDPRSLSLIELVDYQPKFDAAYLDDLISKAKGNWTGISPDDWLHELRGGYEA